MLALLRDESAAQRVERLVDEGEAAISSINLGEVLYALIRSHGDDAAEELVDGVRNAVSVVHPDWALAKAAARVKAGGAVSYADAFCLATGERRGAPVITGDPELLALRDSFEVLDLRTDG